MHIDVSMNLDDLIKIILIQEGINKTQLVQKIKDKYGKEQSLTNLTNKLKNETLKFRELREIMELLGYEVTFQKK